MKGEMAEMSMPRKKRIADLAAALGVLAVGEDALLAHLHAANAALEPRRARDDVCHALPPRGQKPAGKRDGDRLHEREPQGSQP